MYFNLHVPVFAQFFKTVIEKNDQNNIQCCCVFRFKILFKNVEMNLNLEVSADLLYLMGPLV